MHICSPNLTLVDTEVDIPSDLLLHIARDAHERTGSTL